MKRIIFILLLAGLCLPVALQSCKTETDPRPLADINTLAGRWAEAGYEINFDVATRSATLTKAPTGDPYGFKVGQVKLKNVEPIDATTFRGESRYSSSGYYLFADIKITVSGDVMTYISDAGSLGSLSVTGQTGRYQRVK